MIIVRMIGGLGNQMFQYAYAKELAYRFGDEICLDLGAYKRYKVRSFEMASLSVMGYELLTERERSQPYYRRIRIAQKEYHLIQRAIRTIRGDDLIGEKLFRRFARQGCYFNFDPYYYEPPDSNASIKSVYGYFQGETHFRHVKDDIRSEFIVSTPLTTEEQNILDEIESCYAVGVSIRCGHGYRGTTLDVCDENYYVNGMRRLIEIEPSARFFIFSDDVEYVRHNYQFPYPVLFVKGFNPVQSLRLLYSCDAFVISNSTFAWWGAYLSNSSRKHTVAPQIWYKKAYSVPDIYSCEFDILL